MSKGISGLFYGTKGLLAALGEDVFEGIMPNGEKRIDFRNLPGSKGVQVKKRLTDQQMMYLTNKYDIEFAQVYQLGPGKNGRGGKYYIYSGVKDSVIIPVSNKTILINHTHPGGTAYPSNRDKKLMELLSSAGSPQKTSSILPRGKKAVKFTKKGVRRYDKH